MALQRYNFFLVPTIDFLQLVSSFPTARKNVNSIEFGIDIALANNLERVIEHMDLLEGLTERRYIQNVEAILWEMNFPKNTLKNNGGKSELASAFVA